MIDLMEYKKYLTFIKKKNINMRLYL